MVFAFGERRIEVALANGVAKVRTKIRRTTRVKVTYGGDTFTAGSTSKVRIKTILQRP